MNDTVHLYLVMAIRNPAFQASAGEEHQVFLKDLIARGLLDMTGPFTDGTGGAYLLRAADLETATQIAHGDPLHVSGSSTLTVHEWRVRRFP
ncbi:YciI family protein [Luteibacter aegosomatissinici]|uniref:YciI family protein n=1 Tax=Luteibacter aegosomatissinici TaxID=2911539 RepID=UPI001FF774EA|nr:YciI family protein [Luteibacter aegosomatissinici]UPG93259.1 YciI family protein [Luteibacter aegosomatissinici]